MNDLNRMHTGWCLIWVALLSVLAGCLEAAATDEALARLMQQMALRQHDHVAFVERNYLQILERPLESSGELFYDAPDRLEKRTLAPKPESLVLNKGTVTIRRGRRQYALALRDYPQLAPLVDSVRATLAGDLAALQRSYYLQFETTASERASEQASEWTLILMPRDANLGALIRQIRIAGARDRIHTVEISHQDGDHSELAIHALAGN